MNRSQKVKHFFSVSVFTNIYIGNSREQMKHLKLIWWSQKQFETLRFIQEKLENDLDSFRFV